MSFGLSKSRYCSAVQCPKMLWLKKNKPEEFDDSVMNQNVLRTGNEVGDLAMGIFGEFTEIPYGDLGQMIKDTEVELAKGTKIIAEASFSYAGNFCSVDILINHGNKEVEIYEVKSSTHVTDVYKDDVSYQYFVLKKLGYDVKKVCLVYINNKYVRVGELELDKFFNIEDLTAVAVEKYQTVVDRVAFIAEYMQQSDEPSESISSRCFTPYDCGFWKYCTRNLPTPNVFNIEGMQKRSMFKLYNSGIVSFVDVEAMDAVKENYRIQVLHENHDMPAKVNEENIKAFIDGLSYPLYFLDFETFMPAIPLYDYSKPYEQIVFQYSLHYIESEGGELKHKEFLAEPGADPRREAAEHLCNDIPKNVCVMAYNMSFEKGRIKALAELYPDLADHLMNIHDHMVDLMVPFSKKDYYCREMKGSYSIKYVLPALFPNDPSLNYHNLGSVQKGDEASATFMAMQKMSPEEAKQSREDLLRYCELDTYAMVKIWEKLREVVFD